MNTATEQNSTEQNIFITVPAVTLPNGTMVPSFQVGQYVCGKGPDGKAIINAEAKPWVDISFYEAQEVCKAIGGERITETQWLAIAHDAATQDINWTGGKVGEGDLFQGLRNDTVNEAQPGNFVSPDETEQRWLTLSNGERICDLNGNIYQWVSDNVQGNEEGIIDSDFDSNSPSISTPQYPSEEKGMGNYEVWDWSGRALRRGGYFRSYSDAGVFYLNDDSPERRDGNVGVRCTKSL